jgi:hypothetical protein
MRLQVISTCCIVLIIQTKRTPWLSVRKRATSTERTQRPVKLVPTFASVGCHVVSAMDSYGRISYVLLACHYSVHFTQNWIVTLIYDEYILPQTLLTPHYWPLKHR